MMNEKVVNVARGSIVFLFEVVLLGVLGYFFYLGTQNGISPDFTLKKVLFIAFLLVWILISKGFFVLQPNEAAVLLLFGKYAGTVKQAGWHWGNPFYLKRKVSLRSRNLNGDKLKVNDEMGNPIEIAAVIVWHVNNTYEALFDVENYVDYVRIQSESALRHLAGLYPYDITDHSNQLSLRGSTEEVSEALKKELQDRLGKAGVLVTEARLSHLAYAQQMIVEGAVGMVEMALNKLSEKDVVQLDEERKAAMVSNLLVVLCSERSSQPIVNAGQ
jgi:regulator of protease activity HflC (stomatin/prohibitin superfamily)